jgi:hypothetical protein
MVNVVSEFFERRSDGPEDTITVQPVVAFTGRDFVLLTPELINHIFGEFASRPCCSSQDLLQVEQLRRLPIPPRDRGGALLHR